MSTLFFLINCTMRIYFCYVFFFISSYTTKIIILLYKYVYFFSSPLLQGKYEWDFVVQVYTKNIFLLKGYFENDFLSTWVGKEKLEVRITIHEYLHLMSFTFISGQLLLAFSFCFIRFQKDSNWQNYPPPNPTATPKHYHPKPPLATLVQGREV